MDLKKIATKELKKVAVKEAAKKAKPALVNDLLDDKKPSKAKIVAALGFIAAAIAAVSQYIGG
jgi:hypothetical protein